MLGCIVRGPPFALLPGLPTVSSGPARSHCLAVTLAPAAAAAFQSPDPFFAPQPE